MQTNISNFQAFLDQAQNWTIRIEMKPGHVAYAHDREELLRVLHNRDRGVFSVVIYVDGKEAGRATLAKVLSLRLLEQMAGGACVGIAAFYNESKGGYQ